jgi:hypothetical protein
MRLTINLATRNRPHLLIPTINETLKNIREPETRLMVSVDHDDTATMTALRLCEVAKNERVHISVREREDTVAGKWNRAITELPADVYLPGTDYAAYMTPGFDSKIIDAAALFPDGIGSVYGPLANASFPSVQAVTSGLVDRLGYIYPEFFPFWFIDHWLDDVVKIIDRISYADVHCECHARRPSKTTGMRDLHFWAAFYDSCEMVRLREAHAIIDDLQEPLWRKEVLRRHHPLIQYRSRWINQLVRQDAQAIADARGGSESEADARYLRLKAKAEQIMLTNLAELEALAA